MSSLQGKEKGLANRLVSLRSPATNFVNHAYLQNSDPSLPGSSGIRESRRWCAMQNDRTLELKARIEGWIGSR
jgi:hypothetical protein